MFDGLHEAMRNHAEHAWPEPVCGAVVGAEDAPVYLPATGVADPSRDTFRMDETAARRLADRHGALLGFTISNPSAGSGYMEADRLLFTPSAAEMVAQASLGVPFGVVVCQRSRSYEPWWFGDQCPTPALLGRPFRHGVTDCYSFIRDWFRLERGIVLPDFPRDWNWWLNGQDFYNSEFYGAGMRRIDLAQAVPGDLITCKVRSRVPNHAVILLPDGWMGHHLGALEPYAPMAMSRRERQTRWLYKLGTCGLRWHEDF